MFWLMTRFYGLRGKVALFVLAFALVSCDSRTASTEMQQSFEPSMPLEWVKITGGCFAMGEPNGYPEERPVRDICVDDFYVTRSEITNAQFNAFVLETDYQTQAELGWGPEDIPELENRIAPSSAVFAPSKQLQGTWWRLVEGANWRHPKGPKKDVTPLPNHPVVHVTQRDAQAFASWVSQRNPQWDGARLPTEAEWEFAARQGPQSSLWDWENAEAAALEGKANTWQGLFPVMDKGDDGYAGLAPVGSFPANPAGLYDMIGNVWEWTSSPYTPNHDEKWDDRVGQNGLDPNQPSVAVGVVKGGSYLCARSYCYRFRAAARQAQDLQFGTSHIGFRLIRPVRDEG